VLMLDGSTQTHTDVAALLRAYETTWTTALLTARAAAAAVAAEASVNDSPTAAAAAAVATPVAARLSAPPSKGKLADSASFDDELSNAAASTTRHANSVTWMSIGLIGAAALVAVAVALGRRHRST